MKRRTFTHLISGSSLAYAMHPWNVTFQNKPMRVGVIGLDTSHSVAFSRIINEADTDESGFRVTHAYPYGSREIESSYSRIPRYTDEIKELKVEITDSIGALLDQVDVVLLETNDGRLHLEQALQVFEAGKKVFIDKPIAASLADTLKIFAAAEEYNVPVFSASSLRFSPGTQEVANGTAVGEVLGADTYSPARLEETHPDLFWYGIHGIESLCTIMGTGCKQVRRTKSDLMDQVTAEWADGRIGTFRGLRTDNAGYGGLAYGTKGVSPAGMYEGYEHLVVEILKFFSTGQVPVSSEETIEIFALMAAAHASSERNGEFVTLEEVIQTAQT